MFVYFSFHDVQYHNTPNCTNPLCLVVSVQFLVDAPTFDYVIDRSFMRGLPHPNYPI